MSEFIIVNLFVFVVYCSVFAVCIYKYFERVRSDSYRDFLEKEQIRSEKHQQRVRENSLPHIKVVLDRYRSDIKNAKTKME